MPAVKSFAHTASGHVLMSDERDIAILYSNRQAVWDWCSENKITVEYQCTLGGTDVWRIRDDEQRMWFTLRWS
jgi:hypothetical protein